jgi:bifunctional ADP-heptose synthase (sugar kinase/adenylyltransferase)
VKGGDYQLSEIVGADTVLSRGGQVKTLDFIPGYSTTSIEKKIKNNFNK